MNPSAFDYALLFVVAGFAGGWAIPVGITFGMDPLAVMVLCWLGTVVVTAIWMELGDRGRAVLVARLGSDAERRIVEGRAARIVDRWGVVGLATGGLLVLGPTITMLAVLVLGVDGRRFLIWSSVSTIVMFAALTAFWSTVL